MSSYAASNDRRGWTPAQWFCLVVGATLVLAGLLGFLADSTFDTGENLDGDTLLGLEVNGFHNIVHLLTGLFLLAGARAGQAAKPIALAFGAAYLVVTIIGLIDGSDILGLLPINAADNGLHILLTIGAFLSAFLTRDDGAGRNVDRRGVGEDRADEDARAGVAGERDGRLGDSVRPGQHTR